MARGGPYILPMVEVDCDGAFDGALPERAKNQHIGGMERCRSSSSRRWADAFTHGAGRVSCHLSGDAIKLTGRSPRFVPVSRSKTSL